MINEDLWAGFRLFYKLFYEVKYFHNGTTLLKYDTFPFFVHVLMMRFTYMKNR